MSMFFFHFFDGEKQSADDVGLHFDSAEIAYLEAVTTARAMWPELLAARSDPRRCFFIVADEKQNELFRLEFSELLDDCRDVPATRQHSNRALSAAITETHQLATRARAELQHSLSQVCRSLDESASLLARIATFERRPPPN